MKKQDRTQYLAITVSLRQVGMRRTLEYLAQFEEFGITKEDCKEIQSHRVASSKILNMNVVMFIDYVKEIKH